MAGCFLQSSLTEEHLQSLDNTYEQVYKAKYPIVGYMSYLIDQQSARDTTKEDLWTVARRNIAY